MSKEIDVDLANRLNRKKIDGCFYNDIKAGIIERFKKIYGKAITVNYESNNNQYSFNIFINGKTISNVGDEIDTLIFVDKFINTDAIKLFANKYTLDEFNEKYNDYSYENHKILEVEIKKLIKEYSDTGIVFDKVDIDERGYYIELHHPLYSVNRISNYPNANEFATKVLSHYFCVVPISKSTMKAKLNDIKRKLKAYNAQYVNAALTGEKIW